MVRHTTLMLVAAAMAASACDDDTTSPAGVQYRATMSGANEAPTPVTTSATGTADFALTGNTLTYTVSFAGLTSNAVSAHIHAGAAGQSAPPFFDFAPPSATSGTITGSIDLTLANVANIATRTVSPDSLRKLLNGGTAYVNVHSANHTAGEIRGQIVRR